MLSVADVKKWVRVPELNLGPGSVRSGWDVLSKLPGGKAVFSKMIGTMAPYSGTIGAQVLDLAPGYGCVELKDRRAVRNHLRSVHAVALACLAELSTGLAFIYGLPEGSRSIMTGFSIEYVKKARGTLRAEATCPVPETHERAAFEVRAVIKDASGDVVSTATATWLIGPPK